MPGTAVYPGAVNTFVRDHESTGRLTVSFSRNVSDFALPKYVQYREVSKTSGLYLKISTEQAARLVAGSELSEYVWPDGADRPRRNSGTESFKFEDYRTERYDFDFTLGYKTRGEASWNIQETEAAFKAQLAMTGRTRRMVNVLQDSNNWDASHVSAVSSIPGVVGRWDLSTTERLAIKKSWRYAREIIRKHTLGVVKSKDLQAVFAPDVAYAIGESQEVVDYVKQSPVAWQQVRGVTEGLNSEYQLPDQMYGTPVIVEDAVLVSTRRGEAPSYGSVMASTGAFIMARPGALVSKAGGGPNFSTATIFLLEEMTVETLDMKNDRRMEGHVVDDYDPVITAGVSGFFFQNPIT